LKTKSFIDCIPNLWR